MAKPKKLSYYRKKADDLLQDKYRTEWPKCTLCKKKSVCVHHFFPKSASAALRYQPENLVPVCKGCHLKFHSRNAAEAVGNLLIKRGVGWFIHLCWLKKQPVKTNKKYYEEIINNLEKPL